MQALYHLWLLKVKGGVRNLFRKPSSAIFTILMILLYGGLFVMMLTIDEQLPVSKRFNVHLSIMVAIGFCALMIFILMMQKKKALFLETDSFYLFSGPFRKVEVMNYLSLQSILQSLLYGALAVFIMVCYSLGANHALLTLLLIGLVCSCVVFFFLLLTDYLYILSITNQKYKRFSFFIALAFIVSILVILLISIGKVKGNIVSGLMQFVLTDIFYFVPVFGWAKLFLISFIEQEYLKMMLGAILLLTSIGVLHYFFVHFKGDFYEQALEDSIAYTALYNSIKEGKRSSLKEVKVNEKITVAFKEGAMAIASKNILLMKKTKDWIHMKDIFIMVFYLILSYFADLGYLFYMYLLMVYVYTGIEESSLLKEFENYQIYLIPDHPFKKLMAVLLPNLFKICFIITIAMAVAGVVFRASIIEVLLNTISMYGYILVFTAASIVSIRILKSRTNRVMVSMMRMLLLFACVLPAVGLTLIVYIFFADMNMAMYVATYAPLALNIIISLLLLFACKNMLNGRILNDD